MTIPEKYSHLVDKQAETCERMITDLEEMGDKRKEVLFEDIIEAISAEEMIKPTVDILSNAPSGEDAICSIRLFYLGFELEDGIISSVKVIGNTQRHPNNPDKQNMVNVSEDIENYDYVLPIVSINTVLYSHSEQTPMTLTGESLAIHCIGYLHYEISVINQSHNENFESEFVLKDPYKPLFNPGEVEAED